MSLEVAMAIYLITLGVVFLFVPKDVLINHLGIVGWFGLMASGYFFVVVLVAYRWSAKSEKGNE